ncbi:AAA family ATPase [Scatolibacter rhodanostii]|uniref:AAA family ATPase n=1 Tax=Scatolibacter rhodanostii TaxID=2014781 RepID=UPI000C088186|nr:AAA family ATPase [Scatolibacter rhodanostii]
MYYIQSITKQEDVWQKSESYVKNISALANFEQLSFNSPITFFVGENGSGKSTLLEAIAVKYGFNPEGGSKNYSFATKDTHSPLSQMLDLAKTPKRAKDGFFLRAESFYNTASYMEEIDHDGLSASYLESYFDGKSLHEQSHGESFLSIIENRFWGNGIYILDEPEAALSPSRQLTLMSHIARLIKQNSQFIIATHSPILLAFPGAIIYSFDNKTITPISYKETEHYQITHNFLNHPERMLDILLN